MTDLDPVREYLWIEAWTYEDGRFGYRIKSQVNTKLDPQELRKLLFCLAESQTEGENLVSVYAQSDGTVVCRRSKCLDIETKEGYCWFGRQLLRAFCLQLGYEPPEWGLRMMSVFWYARQFRRSLSKLGLAWPAPRVTALLLSDEPSERVEKAAEEGGNVVPLVPPKRT